MDVRVITPAEAVVDLDVAKLHLNVDSSDWDDLIPIYLAAAQAAIDGPGGWLGRAIGVQTLEARFDGLDCELVRLPYPPLISIVSVTYDDPDGAERTLAADQYSLDPAGLLRASGVSWPSVRSRRGSVRVRYTAGYETAPPPIVAAILLMTGDLFATRETVVTGTIAAAVPMSTTVERLLSPYRVWTV